MMTVVEVSKDKEALYQDNAINLYILYLFIIYKHVIEDNDLGVEDNDNGGGGVQGWGSPLFE